jgi:1-acyl-sn-glycerol-3-phosphate acyltransferase
MQRLLKTLYDHLATYALLAFLAVLILVWTALALVLLSPLPRRWRRTATRVGIMRGFRIYTWALTSSGAYVLDLSALDSLQDGPPVILAPNHPTLIDAILILTRHPNLACVLKPELMGNFFLGAGARLARYIRGWPPRRMIREAIEDLQQGGVLLLFPEGTRTTSAPVNKLTASVGVIAKHARVPVQVAIIETDSPYLSKGWSLFRVPSLPITYRVRLGRRLEPTSDVPELMAELEREFATELAGATQSTWLGDLHDQQDSQLMHPR